MTFGGDTNACRYQTDCQRELALAVVDILLPQNLSPNSSNRIWELFKSEWSLRESSKQFLPSFYAVSPLVRVCVVFRCSSLDVSIRYYYARRGASTDQSTALLDSMILALFPFTSLSFSFSVLFFPFFWVTLYYWQTTVIHDLGKKKI